MPPDLSFHEWFSIFLEFRIQMARKGLCVTRHGWFAHPVDTDLIQMIQNG